MKLAATERWSLQLEQWLKGHELFTSALARVELGRAIRRLPVVERGAAQILRTVRLVAVDDVILSSAAMLDPPELRTLDAIHLATALSLGADLDSFVTYDRQQGRAAGIAGLRVESPR